MKIINVDIDDKIQLKNIEDSKTGEIKFINADLKLPTGNFQSILMNFNLISFTPESDLKLIANFLMSNTKKSVDVEIKSIEVDGKTYKYACYIPADVFERECNITLGLYGFSLDENKELKKRISFIPETGMVVRGSYDPNGKEATMPSPTVFEEYFQQVKDINEQIGNEYQGIIDRLEEIKDEHITDFNTKIEEDKNASLDNYVEEVKIEIDNHFNEKGATYREDINDNTSRIKRLEKDVFDSGEASGSSLNIQDSTLAEFQEMIVNGVSDQVVTTGKNKLNPYRTAEYEYNGVTVSYDETTQEITLNGTCTTDNNSALFSSSDNKFTISAGTTLYGLIKYISGSCSGGFSLRAYDSNYAKGIAVRVSDTITSNVTGKNTYNEEYTLSHCYIRFDTGSTFNNLKIKVMLSLEETDYEPYTGGLASPSPEYPQSIDVIDEAFNVKSTGKNLIYGYATREFTQNGMNVKMEKGKSEVIIDGTCEKLHSSPLGRVYLPVGKYTCSVEGINIHDSSHDRLYILDEQTTKTYGYGVQDGKPKTFEIKEAKEYRVDIVFKEGTTYENKLVKVQIEKGEVATEYEPYQETLVNVELPDGEFIGSAGDIKDKLRIAYNEEDKQYHLYLEKNTGKVILKGNENWGKSQYGTNAYFIGKGDAQFFGRTLNTSNDYFLSIIFDNRTSYTTPILYIDSNNQITIRNTPFANVDELKAWLAEHNTTVLYALLNPYTIDLGVIDMPLSYYPITNVFTSHDLQPVINAKYYRDIKNTIVTMQTDIEALKQAVATLTTAQTNLANEVDLLQASEEVVESEVSE